MVGEEIYFEIESTLDQLIENAEAMNSAARNELTKTEVDAFQKTQESLLAHLIHMDGMLEKKQTDVKAPNKKSVTCKIKRKLHKFEKLNNEFVENTADKMTLIHFPRKRTRKKPVRTRKSYTRLKNQ
ncbi:MAG: hypothetical protein COT84_06850 [Chlamydiae bacterium CG10_big_fil_rev_8_21_14_0_10_35_9]|nr:MAG: hypothetical protein COT84_06850 [Chlamydiae bacterium CG10_big_fil_rev_8_21_14_0_10_35_9]